MLGGNARAYIAGLTNYRSGGVARWCGLFAAAMRTAAVGATRFAEKLHKLQGRWMERAGNPRADAAVTRLIPGLPAQPIVDVKTAEELCKCSNQAARLAMLQLEKAGVLRQVTLGKRNRAWEATELFDLLNQFERDLASPTAVGRPGRPVPR